jgi:hypothetical protein
VPRRSKKYRLFRTRFNLFETFQNESPLNFGQRIQTVRSQLSAKVNSLSVLEMSDATKTIYLKQYDNMALKTFIRGLTGTLQNIIRLRDPKSLETAMNLVVEEQISTITNKSLKTLKRAQIGFS